MDVTPAGTQMTFVQDLVGPGDAQAALQDVYLTRLQRLLRLRRQHEQDLNQHGMRLLDHSIFAAYCDCRDLGAESRARSILRAANFSVSPAEPPDVEGAA
jgi:hypothetical protein